MQNVIDQTLRVTSLVGEEETPKHYKVPDLLTALILMSAIGDELLRFDDKIVPFNSVTLEVFDPTIGESGEWVEWESVEGYDAGYYGVDEKFQIFMRE